MARVTRSFFSMQIFLTISIYPYFIMVYSICILAHPKSFDKKYVCSIIHTLILIKKTNYARKH